MSPAEIWVSSGLLQRQGLWVWHKSSWRRSPLTPPQSSQNLHRTGKQTLGGHKQNLVHIRSHEKGAVSPQETGSNLTMSIQESQVEAWVNTLTPGQTTRREHSPTHQQKIQHKSKQIVNHSYLLDVLKLAQVLLSSPLSTREG